MPATKTRHTHHAPHLTAPSHSQDVTAAHVFSALAALHELPSQDVELLCRAAAGMRFIQSTGAYTRLEHELFEIALAELPDVDSLAIESAACWAADLVPFARSNSRDTLGSAGRLRALWIAAILRISDAYCAHSDGPSDGVFAAWTDTILYLEFDGDGVSERRLSRVRDRVAALEALTGRTVVVSGSIARRGAA